MSSARWQIGLSVFSLIASNPVFFNYRLEQDRFQISPVAVATVLVPCKGDS